MIMIKTIKEVFTQIGKSQFIDRLKTRLNNLMPLEINEVLSERVYNFFKWAYEDEDYHFLPIDKEYINEEDVISSIYSNVIRKLSLKLVEKASILSLCNNELTKLDGLSFEKDYNKTYAKEKTTGGTYAMSENSPIDANINNIVTPNMKSQASSNASKEFEGSDNEKESNPYYYEKYLQILNKYNIFEIISDCCKSVIYEYNTLI